MESESLIAAEREQNYDDSGEIILEDDVTLWRDNDELAGIMMGKVTEEELDMSDEDKIEKLKKEIALLNGTIKEQEKKAKVVAQQLSGEPVKKVSSSVPTKPTSELPSSSTNTNASIVTPSKTSAAPVDLSPSSVSSYRDETPSTITSPKSERKPLVNPIRHSIVQDPNDILFTQDQLSLLIEELEEQRLVLEEEGYFVQAEQVHQKIVDVYRKEAGKIELSFVKLGELLRIEIMSVLAMDMDAFDITWDQKQKLFENQSKELLKNTIERQKSELAQTERVLRSQLHVHKPKFSKNVLDQRAKIVTLVKSKEYRQAEAARKQLLPLEIKEIEQFEKNQEEKLKKKLVFVESRHRQEIEVLSQRILSGKRELEKMRKTHLISLTQQQNNVIQDFDNKYKKSLSQVKQFISKLDNIMTTKKKSISNFFNTLPRDVEGFKENFTSLLESLQKDHKKNYAHLYEKKELKPLVEKKSTPEAQPINISRLVLIEESFEDNI